MMMCVCVCVDIACVFYTSSWYVPCLTKGYQPYGGPPLTVRNWHGLGGPSSDHIRLDRCGHGVSEDLRRPTTCSS